MKVCVKCGRELPSSSFHRSNSSPDGLQSYCKDCKHDHAQKRYSEKRDEILEKNAVWRNNNRGRMRALVKSWKERNIDKVRASVTEWRNSNRAYWKEYHLSHRDRHGAANSHRRALERSAVGTFSRSDVERLLSEQCGKCYYCGCPLGPDYHVDHKQPLSRGGSNWPDNLAVACPTCNLRKNDRTEGEFFEYLQANPE